MARFEKLKALLSHHKPDLTYAELFELLAELALKKLDPEAKSIKPVKKSVTPGATPPAESGLLQPPALQVSKLRLTPDTSRLYVVPFGSAIKDDARTLASRRKYVAILATCLRFTTFRISREEVRILCKTSPCGAARIIALPRFKHLAHR